MYDKLLQRLNSIVLLNPDQQKDLCRVIQAETYSKEVCLLEEGKIANQIYFVMEGVIRSFKKIDDKEVENSEKVEVLEAVINEIRKSMGQSPSLKPVSL